MQAYVAGLDPDVEAGDGRTPAAGRQQRAQHPHGGRLAGAVGAEEAVDLAFGDLEIDVVDRGEAVELAHEALGADGDFAHGDSGSFGGFSCRTRV